MRASSVAVRAGAMLAIGVCSTTPVAADTPPEAPPPGAPANDPAPGEDAAAATAPPNQAALRTRARQIRELIDGTLDPQVSLDALLRIDVGKPAFAGPADWIELLRDPPPETAAARRRRLAQAARGTKAGEAAEEPTPAAALRSALRAFLLLPAEERAALIQAHRDRGRALEAEKTRSDRLQKELLRLEHRARDLAAFLAGELDPAREPDELLTLSLEGLADPTRRRRLSELLSAPREDADEEATPDPKTTGDPKGDAEAATKAAPATPEAEAKPQAKPATDAPGGPTKGQGSGDAEKPGAPRPVTPEDVQAAEGRVDALLARYLALSPGARQALFDAHEERRAEVAAPPEERSEPREAIEAADRARAEAREASAKQRQALQAAEQAHSNSLRLLEEERARLHALEAAQAHEQERLAKERARLGADRERALGLKRRVDALASGSSRERRVQIEAEALHDQIEAVLDTTRRKLQQGLDAIIAGPEPTTRLGERLDESLLHEEHRGRLDALWSKLEHRDAQLRYLQEELSWDEAQELRDAMVALNDARLTALSLAPRPLRVRTTGFGPEGREAGGRELTQVALELRYHLLSLPRHVAEWREQLARTPGPALWSLFQLALILLLFRLWRRNANRWLSQARRWARQHLVQSWSTRSIGTLAYYLRRIHGPLDWLVLLWLVLGTGDALPELRFVRLSLLWILGGSLVVLVLDAMASRQTRRGRHQSDNAALRLRSLRLVGLTVVTLGLILSLTTASVGKGTIHSWTLVACWVLALPLVLLLVYWWRAIVFDRLDAMSGSSALARVLAGKRKGPLSVPAAVIGAGFLLGRGLFFWARDEVYEFELMRRVLAYVVRSQVTRQSRAVEGRLGNSVEPVSDIQARYFRPEATPDRIVDYATDDLRKVAEWSCESATTLTAVVGERGRGKSTFLHRLRQRIGEERVLVVPCPGGEPERLFEALAEGLGLEPGADEERIAEALRSSKLLVVCVDDAQRLVRPTIEGLEHLDRLEELARAAGTVSWVLTIDAPAWSFVERAFGDRVSFDHVVMLPAWTEAQLGELIRVTTERAGLDPTFDELVGRRQLSEMEEEDEERIEHSFYRILWDSSDGNASVALRYWRHSLFQDADGKVMVRMFDEPATSEIDASPLTVLFVLRSILQMDLADREDLAKATNLTEGQVHNALRFAQARGFVEEVDGMARVSWPWFRPITRVLRRRRLLVM